MIRPRPTQHIAAEPFGLFVLHNHAPAFEPRAEAYCPCGTRLSRYRPIGDIWCAPCQAKRVVIPDELHPTPLTAWERQKPHRHVMCPGCGGPMHRHARLCKPCHLAHLNRKDIR